MYWHIKQVFLDKHQGYLLIAILYPLEYASQFENHVLVIEIHIWMLSLTCYQIFKKDCNSSNEFRLKKYNMKGREWPDACRCEPLSISASKRYLDSHPLASIFSLQNIYYQSSILTREQWNNEQQNIQCM